MVESGKRILEGVGKETEEVMEHRTGGRRSGNDYPRLSLGSG